MKLSMNICIHKLSRIVTLAACSTSLALAENGVVVEGELKEWHKITLTIDGPMTSEQDENVNPFTENLLDIQFTHESGSPSYLVPGYYAADGNAGETSATEGNKWRAHLSPDKAGVWNYTVKFKGNKNDGVTGSFAIKKTDKVGRDLRAKGRLQPVEGSRYMKFSGNDEWFLKAGADSPETFLAYEDFDGTRANNPKKCPLKTWSSHVKDWNEGDPTWKDGKGKGMIGAINYLATRGCNAFSFIPYNAGGDGDNVWPHTSRDEKLRFDCSKLDQWEVVFDHGTKQGMFLHFKLQETENDDLNYKKGDGHEQALDDGELGPERKAYFREMVARYGHNLALNWNIGEENTQSIKQIEAQAKYLREIDPYGHLVVLHTYPSQHDKVYGKLVGKKDILTGISMQNSDVRKTHEDALKWIKASEKAGHKWVVSFDESGNAGAGNSPDLDYPGMAKIVAKNKKSKKPLDIPTVDEVRVHTLWGTIMAGGTGVEYYFGYRLPENDLLAEDWRSRHKTWGYSGIALKFFQDHKVPVWEMQNHNELLDNDAFKTSYALAKKDETYLVFSQVAKSAEGKSLSVDLSETKKEYSVKWFNPREGGELQTGTVDSLTGGQKVNLGFPPTDHDKDWAILLTTQP